MNKKGKTLISCLISWIINIIYSILMSWATVIGLAVGRNYGWSNKLYIYELIIIFAVITLINLLLVLLFKKLKFKYNKVVYWIGNILFALPPYAWFILCCIDNYIRYGSFSL